MADENKDKNDNVINLAQERKKQRTLRRQGASSKNSKSSKRDSTANGPPNRSSLLSGSFGIYLKTFAFIVVLWYLMRSCGV